MHCVDLGESCPNFHFSVSLHVPFSQFSFRTDSYSNEYLLAKIGVDTAENELLEVLFNIIQYYSFVSLVLTRFPRSDGFRHAAAPRELRAEIEGAKNLILNSSGDIHIAKGHGHAWLPTFDIEQRGLKEKVISDLNFFRSFSNAELKQSFGRNFRPAGRVDDFQKSYFWHLAKRVGIYESLMEKPELIEELIPSRFRRGGFSKDCGSLLSSN